MIPFMGFPQPKGFKISRIVTTPVPVAGPEEGPPRKKTKSPPVISPTGSSTSLYSGSSSLDWSKKKFIIPLLPNYYYNCCL